ncbi:MAG: methylmalonyl-CoA mutase family protein [Verrucomicrobiota bacterium]
MSELTLNEFSGATYEQWRKEAEITLKGAPFEKKLVTKTYEGIDLQPIYNKEDIANLKFTDSFPGFTPYLRSDEVLGYNLKPWEICQKLNYATPKEFNSAARHDVERGLTALNIWLDKASRDGKDPEQAKVGEVGAGGLSIASLQDLAQALQGIDLTAIPLFVRSGASALPFGALLFALARKRGYAAADLIGCIEMDPIGVLSHEGTLPQSLESAYHEMAVLTAWAKKNAPKLQTICVHSRPYHESGANAVQELAFSIAKGAEYLRELSSKGLSVDDVAPRMRFSFTVGSNFFMEIAKLRAARLLWARIVKAFGGSEASQRMTLHVRTALFNKTVCDPYVNMLRTTAEAFSAVLGGVDSLHVGPFDDAFRLTDDFSRRIARNTQLILQKEAQLARVIDPAGGSWYVESLTEQLARKAWALFQEVEKQGGLLKSLEAGFPQGEIEKIAKQRVANTATRRDVIVGTNMYPNVGEPALEARQVDFKTVYEKRCKAIAEFRTSDSNFDDTVVLDKLSALLESKGEKLVDACIDAILSGATLGEITRTLRSGDAKSPSIKALKPFRLAEQFEKLRKNADDYLAKTGARSQVFLANFGPIKQHKARADFASTFVQVGGFDVINPKGFASPDEAAKAAVESGAPVVVICSTDDTYPEIVPAFTKAVKAAKPEILVLLAGYPTEQIESFKQAGVDDFIHVRANCHDLLANLQAKVLK